MKVHHSVHFSLWYAGLNTSALMALFLIIRNLFNESISFSLHWSVNMVIVAVYIGGLRLKLLLAYMTVRLWNDSSSGVDLNIEKQDVAISYSE